MSIRRCFFVIQFTLWYDKSAFECRQYGDNKARFNLTGPSRPPMEYRSFVYGGVVRNMLQVSTTIICFYGICSKSGFYDRQSFRPGIMDVAHEPFMALHHIAAGFLHCTNPTLIIVF